MTGYLLAVVAGLGAAETAAAQYAVRPTDGVQNITWKTAPLPTGWNHDSVTFVWSGGIGYRSQPDAAAFELALNGQKLLDIPFTSSSTEWPCGPGATLRYFVLRKTPDDTAGLFFLTLPTSKVPPSRSVELTLSAPGKGSRRWISLVPYRDVLSGL